MNHFPITPRSMRAPALRTATLSTGRAIGFFAHFIAYVLTCLIVWVTAGLFSTVLVALGWGIGLALHGLFALIVPMLRALEADDSDDDEPYAYRDTGATSAPVPAPAAPAAPALHEVQRARSLEELSAAIAHEIRNPITAAKSLVQQIAEDPSALETAEHARVAVEELDRVERSIAHLLRFAREEPFEPTRLNIADLIESAIELLRDRASQQGVSIERDIEPMPSVIADGEQLRKVLANLIGNALDAHQQQALATNPTIAISAGRNLAGNELWIRVRDNGPGLDATARSRAFQPFYTSKPGGTGLGLALARKVLARHAGSIELVDSKGQGAEFLLVLPWQRPAEARP